MIEGDDIGGSLMAEPASVKFDHGGQGEQVEAERVGSEAELIIEEVASGTDEGRLSDAADVLSVADEDFVHVSGLPRCSS
jgi:hypothetical protein